MRNRGWCYLYGAELPEVKPNSSPNFLRHLTRGKFVDAFDHISVKQPEAVG